MGKGARIKRERAAAAEAPPKRPKHDVRLTDHYVGIVAHGREQRVSTSAWESGAQIRCDVCGQEMGDEW